MAQPALEFVNAGFVNGPEAEQNRRRVRSHAAKASGGGAASSSFNAGLDKFPPQQKPPRKRRRPRRQNLSWAVQVRDPEYESQQPHHSNTSSASLSSSGGGSRTSPLSPLSGMALIPASKSPVYHEPYMPIVVQNYLDHLAVAIPELDGGSDSVLLKTRWFPMVMHSPVIFQVIVLFSASHYAAQRRDSSLARTLLSLKQCALHGLRQSLSSASEEGTAPVRDELIAATAKMASYEAIWGDAHAYHWHMRAVDEMLRVRRHGLASLGLDGFLSRLLIFIDTNSAFMLNTFLHLPGSTFPSGEPFFKPNLGRFVGDP
ncbi:uncharacterized protein A1O9_04729 [Exophiala aquamarina CBS 119918]|uniref:Transcription factor domain-containing protein n=1 Tax=Exophiala aquamarina CBS 119918 TaxID=1182545 RepID=A0A072PJ29_9EURO|nr:uncharacterized protein A1O9_04729 [Exophiala aquamarina CBS 119918]KEF59881.1 hypothetical protein A1O9_04729 [Exophiala aquamarina CBS 119918]